MHCHTASPSHALFQSRFIGTTLGLMVLAATLAVASWTAAAETHTSELWGKAGERWTPQGRLPDFSYAGYHCGERPIPNVRAKSSVKDFGAVGDGQTDDTRAFQNAIARTRDGALEIPPGRYKIAGILEIGKSNLVLRGAGQEATVLYLSKPLGEILDTVPYADGLLRLCGQRRGQRLAGVVKKAERGDRRLQLSSVAGIRARQKVRLRMINPEDSSLGRHLYGEQGALNAERRQWYEGRIIDWVVEVESVVGQSLILTRPLRTDVRPGWTPEIWSFQPTVQEVGIEDLSIEFPKVPYGGHHKEAGFYAIYFKEVFNCWMRNVTITDADIGVYLTGSAQNTVTGVTLKAGSRTEDEADRATGHYGFGMAGCGTQGNLVTACELQTTFVHNLQVGNFANGNVYAGLVTMTGRFDHHAGAPHENLYTDILIRQRAGDLFKAGGNRADEPNSGARTTFWNIRTGASGFPGRIPTLPDGNPKFPLINLVGLDAWTTAKTPDRAWIERWPGETTRPTNLYQAQLARRLNKTSAAEK